ncbi:hypothetical protein HBI82_019000 [Parastagonospora nodorum]|nr:hypothetical protein HBI82_019000 [Parastagonospora nodorum]
MSSSSESSAPDDSSAPWVGSQRPRIHIYEPDFVVWRRYVYIKGEVWVWKGVSQPEFKEVLYSIAQLVLHVEQKVEVVEISLAQRDQTSITHEAPELDARIERNPLAQYEMIRYFLVIFRALVGCVVKGMR